MEDTAEDSDLELALVVAEERSEGDAKEPGGEAKDEGQARGKRVVLGDLFEKEDDSVIKAG